jgi:hypothetical protein
MAISAFSASYSAIFLFRNAFVIVAFWAIPADVSKYAYPRWCFEFAKFPSFTKPLSIKARMQ